MSFIKKLLKQAQALGKEKKDPETDRGKYMPESSLPADERFTKTFIYNGGKFIYCENLKEVHESFDNILIENDWYEKDVLCYNDNLVARFSEYNLNFGRNIQSAFFFATCENLVADNGSILISSNQIKEKKLGELPDDFVIFATTSQIVNNIGEGLRGIKKKNVGKIPTNITTIKNFQTSQTDKEDFLSYGSSCKNLYLLLLEDL
ncbi:MAG: LUD domain-containing protein [Leeuwenhoekiella sp.]